MVEAGADAVTVIATATADVTANEAENKQLEVEMHAEADDDYLDALRFRRRKEKKVNFFMWIMNNKKMALGLVLFLLGAIIFGCVYCYVSSSLGFHKDEEYCVSKYRA
ncbi:Uncharacterized protein PCOAH_00055110 [Plasmodium coatneyi]|uniref:Transmembrane protein n=1 Tax=Plasmodium coatneyi TaxID=208452 RepID=A0A1B1E8M1_9APIC|nr:Uncharacterized protein PCOAH_00055110 [Plasmodium coatneyi]ANQ11119.1 Uncharacterized protein PCOAH_00055110 [Plasmodium coatneyi]